MAVPPPRSRLVWISTVRRSEPAWRQDDVESCEMSTSVNPSGLPGPPMWGHSQVRVTAHQHNFYPKKTKKIKWVKVAFSAPRNFGIECALWGKWKSWIVRVRGTWLLWWTDQPCDRRCQPLNRSYDTPTGVPIITCEYHVRYIPKKNISRIFYPSGDMTSILRSCLAFPTGGGPEGGLFPQPLAETLLSKFSLILFFTLLASDAVNANLDINNRDASIGTAGHVPRTLRSSDVFPRTRVPMVNLTSTSTHDQRRLLSVTEVGAWGQLREISGILKGPIAIL